jgi:hypothetical protein
LTKSVIEAALGGELTDHLGYEPHDQAGRGSGNARNGTTTKTVRTDVGPVTLEVPVPSSPPSCPSTSAGSAASTSRSSPGRRRVGGLIA